MTDSLYTRKSARSAAFHAVMFRIPAQVATLFGYVVLVRWLPETEFGVYSLLYAMLPMIATLMSFGMENTLGRYQPEYLRKGENRLANRLSRKSRCCADGKRSAPRRDPGVLVRHRAVLQDCGVSRAFHAVRARDHHALPMPYLSISLSAHLLHKYSIGLTAMFSMLKLGGYALAFALHEFTLRTAILVDLASYLIFFACLKYAYELKPDHRKGERRASSRGKEAAVSICRILQLQRVRHVLARHAQGQLLHCRDDGHGFRRSLRVRAAFQ